MAKSTKGKTGKSKIDTSVPDAVEVTDITTPDPVEAEAIKNAKIEDTTIGGATGDDQTNTSVDDAAEAVVEVDQPADDAADKASADPSDETAQDDAPVDEPLDETSGDAATEVIVQEPAPPPPPRQNTFVPLVLGGLAAGAIGYGIATYAPADDRAMDRLGAQVASQAEQIAALEAQLADLPVADVSEVETRIDSVESGLAATLGDMSAVIGDDIAALEARIAEVEKAPNADGTLSDTALAAYQQELDDLRAELAEQQESVMSAAAQAEADLAAARAEAEQLEQEAIAAAEAAVARAALNRVATAVETGAPFADALADLDPADVPVALSDAADTGVATTAQLISDFPAVARAALATARSEGLSDDAGGVGGFLRSQFDVRSTSPQEGPGPDAVLSRAEAAIKEGRVADALAEIDALPEVARAEMTDWSARATARADALAAIATLSENYN